MTDKDGSREIRVLKEGKKVTGSRNNFKSLIDFL